MDAELSAGESEGRLRLEGADAPLQGLRIGFSTAGTGGALGGAEAVLVDIMEGAHCAGADIVCWGGAASAVPEALASRGIKICFRIWPWEARASAPKVVAPAQSSAPNPSANASRWQTWVPEPVRYLAGFLRE